MMIRHALSSRLMTYCVCLRIVGCRFFLALMDYLTFHETSATSTGRVNSYFPMFSVTYTSDEHTHYSCECHIHSRTQSMKTHNIVCELQVSRVCSNQNKCKGASTYITYIRQTKRLYYLYPSDRLAALALLSRVNQRQYQLLYVVTVYDHSILFSGCRCQANAGGEVRESTVSATGAIFWSHHLHEC